MPKLKNFAQFNWSGLVKNKSPYVLENSELQFALNVDTGDPGRIKKRKGFLQFGDTIGSAEIRGLIPYYQNDMTNDLLMVTGRAVYKIVTNSLDGAIAAGASTISVRSASYFDTSGDAEVNGDVFAYTGKSGNDLTGVSGVGIAHADNSIIRQWDSVNSTAFSDQGGASNEGTDGGVSHAQLNSEVFLRPMFGAQGYFWDDPNLTASGIKRSPQATYKERIYSLNTKNRIDFSNLGDGDTYSINDYFQVGQDDGDYVRAVANLQDNIYFFKSDAVYAFNGTTLKPLEQNFGAYNQYVPKKVGNILFTFCARGVYAFNGESAVKISDPIQEYLDDYATATNAAGSEANAKVVKNTYAMSDENKYYLFIDGTDLGSDDSVSNPVFVYDTRTKSWSIYTYGQVIRSFDEYTETSGAYDRKTLMFGNDAGAIFRMNQGTNDNLTGNINAEFITKPFDLNSPQTFKRFGHLKVFAERGGFNVMAKIDDGNWFQLGEVKDKKITRFKFPTNSRGYRCTVKIADNTTTSGFIFNGLIFEETISLDER